QHVCDGSEVEITKDYHPLPQIYAAPDDLRQVFLNIITNALQAMPEKGRLVLATAARDGQLTVTVQDTGPGISKTYLSRIFDPFFTTKGQGEGSGLGLTVAQRIVTKYGGRIQFDSQEGRGTLCRIIFPLESLMRATAPKRSSS
ncbi:MAG: sensor histidine kinase, partial [Nitrospirales bacterium]